MIVFIAASRPYYLLLSFFILLNFSFLYAQEPPGYYDNANGLSGNELKVALHNIIKNHSPHSYAQLWQDFNITDKKPNGKVWDMYSDIPNGTPAYEFTFFTNQCGNYSGEGQCYNREHSWPSSWFNAQAPMYTDLYHIVPTDGYVNNRRSNYPFGEVGQTTWVSTNGSKLGQSVTAGYTGIVFEPIDAYKGDFARGMLYMSTRYYSQDAGWAGSPMAVGAALTPWASALLLKWHLQDPVSQKEIDRNNSIYLIQQNRNPFIDHPEYASMIWDPYLFIDDQNSTSYSMTFWPNPANDIIDVAYNSSSTKSKLKVQISSISGKILFEQTLSDVNSNTQIDLKSISSGMYLIQLIDNERVASTSKLIKN